MTKIDNGRIHKGKEYDKKKLHIKNNIFFLGGGWSSNLRPCIYYAFSLPTELSSRGHIKNSMISAQ